MDNIYGYLSDVTDTAPGTPGGGSVACMALALATATLKKVFYFSRDKLTNDEIQAWSSLQTYSECVRMAERDTELFSCYMSSLKATDEYREKRIADTRGRLAALSNKLARIAEELIVVANMFVEKGNKALINDTLLAKELAETALKTIRRNSASNGEGNV